MNLIIGCLMLSEIGSQLAYCAILRLLTILEKKVFRIWAVLISLSTTSSSSVNASFSLDTILSDKDGLMVFQKVWSSVIFFSLWLLWHNFFVFSNYRQIVVSLFWKLSFFVIISIFQKFISKPSSLHYFFGKSFIYKR